MECLPLPSAENAVKEGFEKPPGATWNFPDEDKTVQFVVTTSAFGQLIGFTENIYPEVVSNNKVKINSTLTPHPTLVNSLILTCNMISSKYYNPINVFCSIPICAKFGSLMHIINPSPIFSIITEGYYNNIVIEFLDQNFNRVMLHDSDVVISLSIKEVE